MLFTALIALLPAFGAATSFLRTVDPDLNDDPALVRREPALAGTDDGGKNACDGSTFAPILQNTTNRPLVSDCKALMDSIREDYLWIVSVDYTRTLATNGTCSFNARAEPNEGNHQGVVGNLDVIDIVRDSIDKFAEDGYVAAEGHFGMLIGAAGGVPCYQFGDWTKRVYVYWTIALAPTPAPTPYTSRVKTRRSRTLEAK